MLHVSFHWSKYYIDDLTLWSFAVKHATWLYSQVLNRVTLFTPLTLLTKTCCNQVFLRTHVWGCSTLMLDPKLQNGQKIQ